MKDGTWASSSAVTDGQRVYAFFESSGLYTYDMAGNLLWQKHLGEKKMFADVGESGITPVLYGNRLVIAWDHQGASFVVALDARTGQELWRADRQEVDSWSTPLVVEHAGRSQVVTTAQNRIRSYDLETGKIVWESEGLTMNPIASPVAGDGMVFAMSGFQGSRLRNPPGGCQGRYHWRQGRSVWTLDRDTPYVPSPLSSIGLIYILKSNSGILSVFDAKTGRPQYQLQRLAGMPEVYSSPVAAQNRVYVTGRNGTTSSSGMVHRSKCWRRTRSTMDSMPRLRWWMTTSISADIAISLQHRPLRAEMGDTPGQGAGAPTNRRFFGVMSGGMVCVRTRYPLASRRVARSTSIAIAPSSQPASAPA